MWVRLAWAQQTEWVGVLDMVCVSLPTAGFVIGRGGNMVIMGLKVKPSSDLCWGGPPFILQILFLLPVLQKRQLLRVANVTTLQHASFHKGFIL